MCYVIIPQDKTQPARSPSEGPHDTYSLSGDRVWRGEFNPSLLVFDNSFLTTLLTLLMALYLITLTLTCPFVHSLSLPLSLSLSPSLEWSR